MMITWTKVDVVNMVSSDFVMKMWVAELVSRLDVECKRKRKVKVTPRLWG